ncbi:MAG: hypothetical protein PVI43_07470 [Candidatus Bathyarchaeota archaeon]
MYQNGNLHNQVGVLEDNLSECQNQTVQCENQINDLQSQNDQLEEQNLELQSQNIELQNQCDQLTQLSIIKNLSIVVRVTNFTYSRLSYTVGVSFESDANITIQNVGTNDLEGLTLTLDHAVYDHVPTQSFKIESLNAGEERIVSTIVEGALGAGVKVVIRIKLDDIILHEQEYMGVWVKS